ncbi:MAG: DUF2993 domain-containing protein [Nitrosospira sp.]|nr:DUF2993 domain-containing protein [Nitrosospira sp.]MDN5882733.1 DUF2993 domain-containing protein [Nitrosospira sp.]MDN5936279.1 DUF2993 domain-containing protein [Nitrosospira sp.]
MKDSLAARNVKFGSRSGAWQSGRPAHFLCAALLLGGCAALETRVEKTIVKELPRIVGAAARYEVEAQGARVKDEVVYLDKARVVGERVRRPKAPILDRVEAIMTDVAVDRKKKKLTSIGGIDAQVRVLATDIEAFLEARESLKNVSVMLDPPSGITVIVQPAIANFTLPKSVRAKVRGRLVAIEGDLIMEIVDLRIAGLPAGAIPAAALQKLINPLVDLSALPAPSQVTAVQVTADAVLLTAGGVQPLSVGGQSPSGAER